MDEQKNVASVKEKIGGYEINFLQPPFGFEAYEKYYLAFEPDVGDALAFLHSAEKTGRPFY